MHLIIRSIFITCVIIWDLCLCINTEVDADDDFTVGVLTELSQLQNQFVASERYYREKLATVEEKLHQSENVQIFYQNKVAEIENLLQASKETEISYKKKLEHVEDLLDQTEQRLTNAERTIQTLISNKKPYNKANNSLIIEQTDASYQTGPEQSTISAPYQNKSFTTFPNKRQDSIDARISRNSGSNNNLQIAFSSYISHHLEHLQTQQTIPFDEIIVNEGNAYDTSTFKFTCPISGVYVFQSALMAQRYKYIQTEIVKESVTLVRMYAATDTTTSRFDQGFNSVITRCNAGEKVWVRVVESWGTDIRSSRFTTFSGYLLWQL